MASNIKLKNNLGTEFTITHTDGSGATSLTSEQLANTSYTVATVAAMEAIVTTTGQACIVTDLDRGGLFVYDSTLVASDNQGTNFSGWVRQYSGAVNVKWFDITSTSTFSELKTFIETNGGQQIDFDGITLNLDVTGTTAWTGINVPTHTELIGSGCSIYTTGTAAFNTALGDLFILSGVQKVEISGFRFINDSILDMTIAGARGISHMISLVGLASDYDTRDIVIRDNYFFRNNGSAIASRSDTVNPENTIKIRNILVEGNSFEQAGGHCITFAHVHNSTVSNNQSYNHIGTDYTNLLVGMFCDISHGCNGIVVDGNIEDGCIHGIKSQTATNEPSDNHVFSNNIFKNFTDVGSGASANQYGIQISGLDTVVTGNVIDIGIDKRTGVENIRKITGIVVASVGDKFVISNNRILSNGMGIQHGGGSGVNEDTYGSIIGNTVTTTGSQSAIWIKSHNGGEIHNNTIDASDSTGLALYIAGSSNVSNNKILGGVVSDGAIYFADTANGLAASIRFNDNTVVGHTSATVAPVQVVSGNAIDYINISGNHIVASGNNALLLRSSQQAKLVIDNNYLESTVTSATATIRLVEGMKGAVINGNTIKVNSANSLNHRAIQVSEGENIITNNNIYATYTCVYLATNYDLVSGNIMNVEVAGFEVAGTIGAGTIDANNIKKLVGA
jgi:hypothetical protein